MGALTGSHPILTCDEARILEAGRFAGNEEQEWVAMGQAGRALAAAVLRDCEEIGGLRGEARLLVLVGKGHNGGDALIATAAILAQFSRAEAEIVFVFGERTLRPLAARAWQGLVQTAGDRVRRSRVVSRDGGGPTEPTAGAGAAGATAYDLCLDGVFGFQFRPPADPQVTALLTQVNALPIRLRAAIDLPSAGLFRADFTYATGSVKRPVVGAPESGRIRYLDLGFFDRDHPGEERVLTAGLLAPLAGLRPALSDKRSYGHLFVVGGSRSFPGAVLMTVQAALRSGAGLVTCFVPESIAAAFAAQAPEAMWVGWPETPGGGLALEGEHLLRERLDRASALVLGPGLGREPETLALAAGIVKTSRVPLVIDADALQPDVVGQGMAPRIVTPHAGEFARISGGAELAAFARQSGLTIVLKGPVTRIVSAAQPPAAVTEDAGSVRPDGRDPEGDMTVYHSFFGGPVLARGGSGDVLAGLIGGLLAQTPHDPLLAAARGVVWHGRAADLLARAHGTTSARVTQLLDFLSAALRESVHDP